jgi:hypothetical protein
MLSMTKNGKIHLNTMNSIIYDLTRQEIVVIE